MRKWRVFVKPITNADVSDLYPPIKFDAGLSADVMVKVPHRYCIFPSTINDTPESCKMSIITAAICNYVI